MTLYEWVYNKGEVAEGVFGCEQCAENMYGDNPQTCYKGGPSAIDEQESRELAADWKTCFYCDKPLGDLPGCCGENPKTDVKSNSLLKGMLPQLDSIQVIRNPFLPVRTMIVSQDVAEMLEQLSANKEGEPE